MRNMLFAVLLALHGVIHLMGVIDYWKLADVEGISRPDVSSTTLTVLGALWLLAGVGFIVGAAALWGGVSWWRPVLFGAAVLSFVIAGIVWQDAWAGMIVDLVVAIVVLPGRLVAREPNATAPVDGAVARTHVLSWRPRRRISPRTE